MRPVAALLQALQAARSVALQMFVASLPAYPKLLAQLRDREPIALCQHDEPSDCFHRGYFFPGHDARECNLSLRIKCYPSLRIVPGRAPIAETVKSARKPAHNSSRTPGTPRANVIQSRIPDTLGSAPGGHPSSRMQPNRIVPHIKNPRSIVNLQLKTSLHIKCSCIKGSKTVT